ncbi:hypothetical protein A9Q81_09140 [Gammaproteobacteria bacterium 42_54_T18]|nr:hypothetical protein A9Q81_09140 [Gammaproteobacteria bacterium 42_54_T18]
MKTIGIVGGGITGLTCAYKLQNEFEVTLFERDDNLGGQAQTAEVNGITVEHAVSVVAELTYVEFFKIMKEIEFDEFKPYALNGLHVHDRAKTAYYLDTNLRRLISLLPKYLKDKPLGIVDTLQLIPFFNRMYADYRKGDLDDVLVLDAYTKYPGYETLVTTVLTILSLITSVQVKNTTIAHVLNFIFDFENNKEYTNPLMQVIKLFNDVTVPDGGVGAYIDKLRGLTKAKFITNTEVINVRRNPDSTVTVCIADGGEVTFDTVIVAAQPFQVGSFLEYKNDEEQDGFSRLAELITHSMVTNHTDEGILPGVKSTDGFVDFRLDYHENASQTTIAREGYFYTAQTLPESFKHNGRDGEIFSDTGVTPDNYSIDKEKILTQHFHAVQHMTPETSVILNNIAECSGEDNLHFACAALSKYPTSQEGGVRSALSVVKKLQAV